MYKTVATFFIWLFYSSSLFAQSPSLPPMRDVEMLPPLNISSDAKLAAIKFSGLTLNIP
jgi:hypothetical protein